MRCDTVVRGYEVTLVYRITKGFKGTQYEPPELPTVEDLKVLIGDQDITDIVTPLFLEWCEEKCYWLEEE